MAEQDRTRRGKPAEARQTTDFATTSGAEGGASGEGRPQTDEQEPSSALGGGVATRTGVAPDEMPGSGRR